MQAHQQRYIPTTTTTPRTADPGTSLGLTYRQTDNKYRIVTQKRHEAVNIYKTVLKQDTRHLSSSTNKLD